MLMFHQQHLTILEKFAFEMSQLQNKESDSYLKKQGIPRIKRGSGSSHGEEQARNYIDYFLFKTNISALNRDKFVKT
jgi:hypothetical protein